MRNIQLSSLSVVRAILLISIFEPKQNIALSLSLNNKQQATLICAHQNRTRLTYHT